MITQLNLWREIMVTFKMLPSIARVDATICTCFADGGCHTVAWTWTA